MGNEQSSPTSRSASALSGFRILRNASTNPPLDSLHPYFDFIVGINGRQIDSPHHHLFTQELTNIALYGARTRSAHVTLGIWSAKGGRLRDVVIPLDLQDKSDITKGIKSLGLTLQWCPIAVSEEVWHVLDVIPNSPADVAGIVAYGDWILGTLPADNVVHGGAYLRGESALGELIEDYINRPLKLYVYNHDYDVVRDITIIPSRTWGGEGALGCVLGYGALHRLPAPLAEPMVAPGETLFEATTAEDQNQAQPHTQTHSYTYHSASNHPGTASSQQASEQISSNLSPQYIIPAAQNDAGGRYSPALSLPVPSGNSTITSVPAPETTSSPLSLTQALPYPHPHRSHNKPVRKTHILMDEYMRESEQKSRQEDYVPGRSASKPGTPVQGSPLRPPPRRNKGGTSAS